MDWVTLVAHRWGPLAKYPKKETSYHNIELDLRIKPIDGISLPRLS